MGRRRAGRRGARAGGTRGRGPSRGWRCRVRATSSMGRRLLRRVRRRTRRTRRQRCRSRRTPRLGAPRGGGLAVAGALLARGATASRGACRATATGAHRAQASTSPSPRRGARRRRCRLERARPSWPSCSAGPLGHRPWTRPSSSRACARRRRSTTTRRTPARAGPTRGGRARRRQRRRLDRAGRGSERAPSTLGTARPSPRRAR